MFHFWKNEFPKVFFKSMNWMRQIKWEWLEWTYFLSEASDDDIELPSCNFLQSSSSNGTNPLTAIASLSFAQVQKVCLHITLLCMTSVYVQNWTHFLVHRPPRLESTASFLQFSLHPVSSSPVDLNTAKLLNLLPLSDPRLYVKPIISDFSHCNSSSFWLHSNPLCTLHIVNPF